jgi:hypothetical protein
MFGLEIDDNVINALCVHLLLGGHTGAYLTRYRRHINAELRSVLHENITRSFVLYPLGESLANVSAVVVG